MECACYFAGKVSAIGLTPPRSETSHFVPPEVHTSKSIRLQPGRYRATQLESLQELTDVNLDPISLATACEAKDVRFRCQSE